MTDLDLSGAGVRVLLIGTETHHGPTLPSVPAIGRTFRALSERLVQRCGVPQEQLRAVFDAPDAQTIASAVAEETARAGTVLLVYYLGHGVLGSGNELYLAATSTDRLTPGMATYQAYSVADLGRALAACRAATVIVILDCCFSGRTDLDPTGVPPSVFRLPPIHGVHQLASAEQLALADPTQQYTAFSGELIRLLDQGDPRGGATLTLDDAYDSVFQALAARRAPAVVRREWGRIGRLRLALNPARPTVPVDDSLVEQSAGPSPYLGLVPYGERDADLFFGREDLTVRLLAEAADRLADPRPLLVVGASGSGKSSLLHAGLLARVRRDGLGEPGSSGWPSIVLAPGERPVSTLAGWLAPGDTGAAERLTTTPEAAAAWVDELLTNRPGQRLLLLVDQLEELFTLCDDPAEQVAFTRALAAVAGPAAHGRPRAVVVGALRADFYAAARQDPVLAAALDDHPVPVDAMGRDELRAAIEGPAHRLGLTLDPGLADLLLAELDAGDTAGTRGPQPGALPLLSHVLSETFDRREGDRLTVRGYRASGGVRGAVADSADRMYQALPAAQRDSAQRMLLRLVRIGDGVADTARPVEHDALLRNVPDGRQVLRALTAARLVTVDGTLVRLSHEVLLGAWPALRGWLEEEREALRERQRLTDAARSWDQEGRDSGALYGGQRLVRAMHVAATAGDDPLDPVEQEFLALSRRRARRRRTFVAAVVVLCVLLASAGVVLREQRAEAARQRATAARLADENASRQIAAQADLLRETDPALAEQLSLAAYRTAATPEARASLYTSYGTPYPAAVSGKGGAVLSLAYLPDGRTLVSSAADGTIQLWNTAQWPNVTSRAVLRQPSPAAISVSPDGRLLAGHTADALTIWDVTSPDHPTQLSGAVTPHAVVDTLAFSPDAHLLASGGIDDGIVRLWDVSDPPHPALVGTVRIDQSRVTSVAFSPDGALLATASDTGTGKAGAVRLWDVHRPAHPAQLTTMTVEAAAGLAFSPVGGLLAAGGADAIHVWRVADPRHPQEMANEDHSSEAILSLAFRPDGQFIATGTTAGTVHLWKVNADSGQVQLFDTLSGTGLQWTLAYPADGRGLAVGTDAGGVQVWGVPAQTLSGGISGGPIPGAAFGQSGRLLATSTTGDAPGGGAMLWDVHDPIHATLLSQLPREWPHAVFLPDDRTLISQGDRGTSVRLWDLSDPTHPRAGATFADPGSTVAVSDDTHLLAIVDAQGASVEVWDVQDPEHPVPYATVTPFAPASRIWFLDGHLLSLWIGADIHLWDLTQAGHPQPRGVLLGAASAGRLLYLRTRRLALTGTTYHYGKSAAQTWDLSDPAQPQPLGTFPIEPLSSFPSPLDNRTLAAFTDRGVLQIWDISDPGRPIIRRTVGIDAAVHSLTTSPDTRLLASAGGFADALQLWRVDEAPLGTITPFAALPAAQEFEFSPDSHIVAADTSVRSRLDGVSGGGVILWSTDPDELYRRMCATPPPVVPAQDWTQYFPNLSYRQPCPTDR